MMWVESESRRHFLFRFSNNFYLFKVSNRNNSKMCEICSKLTIKKHQNKVINVVVVFIVNFEHISHVFLVFLLLTLNNLMLGGLGFPNLKIYVHSQ